MARIRSGTQHTLETMGQLGKDSDWNGTIVWVAFCLCYFSCLKAGEITAPE